MTTSQEHQQTRILVQTAAAVCEDKKGLDTRILELDPVDSALSDFFLITSATNDRQAMAIADEIELQLKHKFGVYPNSVEGRRKGDWILLDYVDFVVHVFLAERRAFYDIERLRKSARPLTPAEFDAELKAELAKKTLAARSKATGKTKTAVAAKPKKAVKKAPAAAKAVPAAKPKKAAKKASAAAKAAPAKKTAAKKAPVKKAVAKKTPAKKTATKKTPVKKAAAKKVAAKKAPVKKVPVKKAAVKKAVAKKTVAKKAVVKKAVTKKAKKK
jgi:ribosome-associated protein